MFLSHLRLQSFFKLTFVTLTFILIFGSRPSVTYAVEGNPFLNRTLFVDTDTTAYKAYEQAKKANASEAEQLFKIATTARGKWFVGSDAIQTEVNEYVTKVTAANALPVLVAYNLPLRDCQGYSAGGSATTDKYKWWIEEFTKGLQNRQAVVIFEPDGLGLINCLQPDDQAGRLDLYRHALNTLTQNPNVAVYIDASMWLPPAEMAQLLNKAGIEKARGISVNTSGYQTNEASLLFIRNVKSVLGRDIHGVIDSSRNGLGPDASNEWCNAQGRALGTPSTALADHADVDAYFWIKPPGESDGECNGGPRAGEWWQTYAVELASRSKEIFAKVSEAMASVMTGVTAIAPIQPTPSPQPVESKLTIFAAGTSVNGTYPTMQLLIDSKVAKTFTDVRGNVANREFIAFEYVHEQQLQPAQVKLQFVNDDGNGYEDRNLIIDRIMIDGVDFQTEATETYAEGSWSSATGCAPGNKQSEWLHCNGFVQFMGSMPAVTPTIASSLTTLVPTPTTTPTVTPSPAHSRSPEGFSAEYFANQTFSGFPVHHSVDAQINFDWGYGSPHPNVPTDRFSIRWSKRAYLQAGTYRVKVTADDGVRVSVGGMIVIDKFIDQPTTTYDTTVVVPATGETEIKIEYYENGGHAVAQFEFTKVN